MPKEITRITSIVPTIEGRQYLLLRSIESLIVQQLPDGVEHEILISFDSRDRDMGRQTMAVIEALDSRRNKDNQIRLINRTQGPAGVAEARNRALQEATGEAIYFLDDDDIAQPRCLEALSEWMLSASADFVAGDYQITEEDERGDILASTHFSLASKWLLYEQILVENMLPMGSYLIRKDLIRRGFNPGLRTLEDWLFLLDNVSGSNVCLCDELVVEIRRARTRIGGHRNPTEQDPQILRDYLLIYGLHPSTELSEERAQKVQQLEKASRRIASPSFLFSGNSAPDALPAIIERDQIKYLIVNTQETIQGSLLQCGQFEGHLAALTCNLLEQMGKEGDIIDVGANQGTYSLAIAKQLKTRRIHAYEAQRSIFMQLCANVLINHCDRIRPHHLAIGNHEKHGWNVQVPSLDPYLENYTGSVSIDMDVVETRRRLAGVAEPWDSAASFESVPLRELDELLAGTAIACIKIDAEGAELDVLKGARNLLQSHKPLLLFESWSLQEFQHTQAQLLEYVVAQGYALVNINSDFLAYRPDQITPELLMHCLQISGLSVQ